MCSWILFSTKIGARATLTRCDESAIPSSFLDFGRTEGDSIPVKGTYFARPLEFQLLAEGESWRQGDAITGTLVAKNHGNTSVKLEGLRVALAQAQSSKVRQKAPGAFKIQKAEKLGTGAELGAGQEARFPWRFELDRNAHITEKASSLYLIYGLSEDQLQLGQLQLTVVPEGLLQELIEILRIHLRFVPRTQRSNAKNWVEIKFAPPDAREYSAVEHLFLRMRYEKAEDGTDDLALEWEMETKQIEAAPGVNPVRKESRELEQRFALAEYKLPNGRIAHERMEQEARAALNSLRTGS